MDTESPSTNKNQALFDCHEGWKECFLIFLAVFGFFSKMLSLLHVNAHPDQNSWYDYAFLWMHMQNRASVVKLSLQWFHSGRIPHHPTVLSISFEVDLPTGKVGGSLLFECRRRELPRGVWGHAPPQKILKFKCLGMLFSTLSRQYLGLKNNQNYAL